MLLDLQIPWPAIAVLPWNFTDCETFQQIRPAFPHFPEVTPNKESGIPAHSASEQNIVNGHNPEQFKVIFEAMHANLTQEKATAVLEVGVKGLATFITKNLIADLL